MPTPQQISVFANWEQVWSESLVAATVPSYGGRTQWVPIPPVEVPILFENHFLAIRTINPSAGARWYLGCRVDAVFQVATAGPNLPLSRINFRRFDARINQTSYLEVPDISPQFILRLDVPFWFDSLDITIWQYIGPT